MTASDRPTQEDPLVAAFDRAARKLTEQRQQMAHEGGQRTGMVCPSWAELSDRERADSVGAARGWLFAAMRAGLLNNAVHLAAQEASR